MTIDTKRLRELAEAATSGPWRVDVDKHRADDNDNPRAMGIYGPERIVDYGSGPERDDQRIVETDGGYYEPEWNDAQWIAAANPQTVVALLDEIERLAKRCEDIDRERHRMVESNAEYRAQLTSIRAAKDEACEIATKIASVDDTLESGRVLGAHLGQRIAALRKVGQP